MALKSDCLFDGRILKDRFTFFCETSPLLCRLQYTTYLENTLEHDVLYVPQASNLAEGAGSSVATVILL